MLKLWRVLNHPSLKAVTSKFTHIRCAHIICQLLEKTRLFIDQRLGPNGLMNKGPRRFPTAGLGGLTEDVRRNKSLYLVNMPSQWNNQDTGNNWATHQGNGHGANMQENGFFGAVQMPKGPDPYLPPTKNGIRYQKSQGKGWQVPNPENCHPVFIKFMARFLQKYARPYFAKVLIVRRKTVRGFPKYGGNFQGKRDMCMHHILEKCMNPNCVFYHT